MFRISNLEREQYIAPAPLFLEEEEENFFSSLNSDQKRAVCIFMKSIINYLAEDTQDARNALAGLRDNWMKVFSQPACQFVLNSLDNYLAKLPASHSNLRGRTYQILELLDENR